MGTMLVELYDALKEAGASKEKARAAAESLVIGGDRLERIEEQTGRLPQMQDQIEHTREDIARLDKEVAGRYCLNRTLPALTEPAAEHASEKRYDAAGYDIGDREVARNKESDHDGNRCRDPRFENRSSRRL